MTNQRKTRMGKIGKDWVGLPSDYRWISLKAATWNCLSSNVTRHQHQERTIYRSPSFTSIHRTDRSPSPGASKMPLLCKPCGSTLSRIFLFLEINSSCGSFHMTPFQYPMIPPAKTVLLVCNNKDWDLLLTLYFAFSICINEIFRGKPRDPYANYSSRNKTIRERVDSNG